MGAVAEAENGDDEDIRKTELIFDLFVLIRVFRTMPISRQ